MPRQSLFWKVTANRSADNDMKQMWNYWKNGWTIFGRVIGFSLIVWIICLPIQILSFVLGAKEMAVFSDNVFNWQPAICLLLTIILFPIALTVAQKETGYFKKQKQEEQNQKVDNISKGSNTSL